MNYKLTKRSATVYGIRIEKPHTWADITIEEWAGGGSFKCVSDYGNYAHIWGSIGPVTLREFLLDCDMDYFLKKVTEYKHREFDVEGTLSEIRRQILQDRREGNSDKFQASQFWRECDSESELASMETAEGFWNCFYSTDTFKILYDRESCDVPTLDRIKPHCRGFWYEVWPTVCEIWREELKQQAA